MEGLIRDEKGQMIILFAAAVIVVIISIAYLHAQNIISGMESSRTMLAYPKEEIRNLKEIYYYCSGIDDCNRQLQVLCAKNGWLCDVGGGIIVFKNVEVCYCEEVEVSSANQCRNVC